MSISPRQLTRSVTYRIDGLGDGVEHSQWRFAGAAGGVVTFHGPLREQAVLAVDRLYEVRRGHLHYVAG
jgi:hypothetical protein